jgi:hypothetical protein
MAIYNEQITMSAREFKREFALLPRGSGMVYYVGEGFALANDDSNAALRLRKATRDLYESSDASYAQRKVGNLFNYIVQKR